ncbi:hypothetical protein [Halorussus sp. MSC15.2]|uniref:hypothetical protein n=1 Tax=Halorussus sp. MSC15.2 TaxID=2283638 RepID=UPI0013D06B64|nr:hypothetical protein [Halorussus sp. MSC15.2]NEU57383.1 hypothetical protein [Halorussus sp. MSC15.2]
MVQRDGNQINIPDDVSEAEWKTQYQEAKREVDIQIERNRWLQEQAAQFLRLLLTAFGLMVAIGSLLLSAGHSSLLSLQTFNFQIESLAKQMAQLDYFSYNLSLFFYVFIIMSGLYSLYLSVFSFIVEIPKNLLSMLDLELLNTGTGFQSIGTDREVSSSSERKSNLLERYLVTIEENQIYIEEKQENWRNGYASLWTSFRRFSAGIGLFIPIYIIKQPIAALLANVLLYIYIIFWLVKKVPYDEFRKYAKFDWKFDVGWVIVTVYTLFAVSGYLNEDTNIELVFSMATFLLLATMVILSYTTDSEFISAYMLRTLSISGIIFILYFFFALNEGDFQSLSDTSLGTRTTASFAFTGFLLSVLLLTGMAIRIAVEKARESKQFLMRLLS